MPNYCYYEMKVVGNDDNIDELMATPHNCEVIENMI